MYIGVGANIAPERNIPRALSLLRDLVPVIGVSPFYRTAPVGDPGQPDYYNGVWQISCGVSPAVLKYEVLRMVERALGRERTADRFAARPIDLDILVYGDVQMDGDGFRLPCPEIATRAFVGVPLWELAGEMNLPGLGSLAQITAEMDRSGLVPLETFTRNMLEEVKYES